MRLILVRHGDSVHGQSSRVLGKDDCPGLSGLGFQQAARLAERFSAGLEGMRFDLILASPYLRARQTADAVCAALGQPYLIEDDLCELRYGVADGLTWAEVEARYGFFNLQAEPDRPVAPGGESWNQYLARVRALFERLAGQHLDGTVLAFTHAGLIVAAFLELFDLSRPGPRARIDPLHTSLTEWSFTAAPSLKEPVWRLERYNDTAHLLPLDTLPRGGKL